jgi:DNA-binding Xre family transcriptional regulator
MLLDKNMTRCDLQRLAGISTTSVAKIGKGENMQGPTMRYKRNN